MQKPKPVKKVKKQCSVPHVNFPKLQVLRFKPIRKHKMQCTHSPSGKMAGQQLRILSTFLQ